MKFGTHLSTCAALAATLTAVGCSSGGSSGPDVFAPTISTATQNLTVDATGMTVDVYMSEPVKQAAAEMVGTWTVSAGNITTATLQPNNRTIRLVLDTVAVPGDLTIGTIAPVMATGNVDLTGLPTAGDTVVVSDGTDAVTFEFIMLGGMPTMGNAGVEIGADAAATIATFITVFNAQTTLDVTAVAGVGNDADLTADGGGVDGNVAITKVGANITVTGMTGGLGLEDLAGNDIAGAVTGFALISSDTTPPVLTASDGVTVPGADNDTIEVVFDDTMIQSEVEMIANWTVQSPIGTAFDLTGATVSYDSNTNTATVTLGTGTTGSAADGNNLQTFDSINVALTGVRSLAGAMPSATPAVGTVTGDDEPPMLEALIASGGTTAQARFSEAVKPLAMGDLWDGTATDAGARFVIADADSIMPAMGNIAMSAQATDTDTIMITDGLGGSEVFEFTSGGGAMAGNVEVNKGADATAAIAALIAAINGTALQITAAPGAGDSTDLTHDVPGAAGNTSAITVVEGGAVFTAPANLAGGLDVQQVRVTADPTEEADGAGYTVDFSTVTPDQAADSIQVFGIQDLAGNQFFPVAAQALEVAVATAPALSGGTAPTADAVSGERNDQIVVTFNTPMSAANILEPSNYTAAPLDISSASFDFDGTDTVTITLDDAMASNVQFGVNSDVTVVNNAGTPLTSAHGVAILASDNMLTPGTGDNAPITMGGTQAFVGDAGNPNTAVVVFPEAVDPVGSAVATNYANNAANAASVTMLDPRTVRLTFAVAPVATDTLTIETAAATDLGGTPAAGQISIALGAVDATAPTATLSATAVSGAGGDQIEVSYSEPVDTAAALIPANYSFTNGGFAVSLTGATVRWNSVNHSAVFTLPAGTELRFGAMLGATILNVSDVSGNALAVQPTAVAIAGDNVAPGFASSSSAFVNWTESAAGTTIDVLFSEDVNEAFVENIFNWTTSGTTVVYTSQLVAPDRVRLTTNAQPAAGETFMLNLLPDLAANTSGMISVNPIE